MGRPSTYTKEIGDKVCAGLEEGRTLRNVCSQEGMPPEATVRRWVMDNAGAVGGVAGSGFAAQYARARELGYQSMADWLIDLADETNSRDPAAVNKARLQSDNIKWLLSKALPKIYGDKLQHQAGDSPVKIEIAWKSE
jgi:hypothetical protein